MQFSYRFAELVEHYFVLRIAGWGNYIFYFGKSKFRHPEREIHRSALISQPRFVRLTASPKGSQAEAHLPLQRRASKKGSPGGGPVYKPSTGGCKVWRGAISVPREVSSSFSRIGKQRGDGIVIPIW